MNLKFYTFLNQNSLRLDFTGHQSVWINLDKNSGRIVTRDKVNTLINIQHTGIWLGKNANDGQPVILHNHYNYGSAYVSSYADYAQGQNVSWKNGACSNDRLRVIEIGLKHVIHRKSYDLLNYNCQTYTNLACHNKAKSEDVAKWAGGALGMLALALLIKAAG